MLHSNRKSEFVLVICFLATAVSLAASAYPAWKAARMDPVEALRYE